MALFVVYFVFTSLLLFAIEEKEGRNRLKSAFVKSAAIFFFLILAMSVFYDIGVWQNWLPVIELQIGK